MMDSGFSATGADESLVDAVPAGYILEELSPHHRQRRVYFAEEHATIPVPITELMVGSRLELYPEVTSRGYFRVGLNGTDLVFQAGGFVGVIPVNDRVTIEVNPRVPIDNLERLIAISEGRPVSLAPHLRHYSPSAVQVPALLDLLTEAFLDCVWRIREFGLHREYQRVEPDTSFPRGRIQVGNTLRRHISHGVRHKVAASWFEQTVDTAPNRCLKYTLWYLAGRYREMQARKGMARLLTELNRAYALFDGVELDASRRFLADPLVANPSALPLTRSYYLDALQLALTIIEQRGVILRGHGQTVRMASWIVDLASIFEDYLRVVLRNGLRSLSPTIRVLNGNLAPPAGGSKFLFDDQSSNVATPDIVVRQQLEAEGEVRFPLIIEVKYKKVKSPEREDLEQTIVYVASYRAPIGLIAIPCVGGAKPGISQIGRIGDQSFYQYAVDLAALEPEEEEARFVSSIKQLLTSESGFSEN